MKSIFDTEASTEIILRLFSLNPDSQPVWGKMNAAQMLAHCNKQLDYYLGNLELDKSSNILLRLFNSVLYNNRPFSKGAPTHPAFIIEDVRIFEDEFRKLRKNIIDFFRRGEDNTWPDHPTFGHLTGQQIGKSIYKHIDHHLKQFNC